MHEGFTTRGNVSVCNGIAAWMSAPETDTIDATHGVRVRVQARVTYLVGQSVGHTDILGLVLGWDLWLG